MFKMGIQSSARLKKWRKVKISMLFFGISHFKKSCLVNSEPEPVEHEPPVQFQGS